MKIWSMALGGYPRSRFARHTLRDVERGTVSNMEWAKRYSMICSEIIGIQKAAGLPVVVDGMVDWHDIFRPFIRSWRNVAVDGLLRFFDNNFFYRIPVFTGEPDIIEPVWVRRLLDYRELMDPSTPKIVLPGPVTFAYLSQNKSGLSNEELAERIAYLLKIEVERAVATGAPLYVQIDEPLLADRKQGSKDLAELSVELVNRIVDGVEDRAILALYFDAPEPEVYDTILNVKAKYLMLDLVDAPSRAKTLLEKGFGDHTPVLGLVDGRRIFEDKISDEIVNTVMSCCKDTDELVVTSSYWFDLIPFKYALKKTLTLSRIVQELSDKLGATPVFNWSIA